MQKPEKPAARPAAGGAAGFWLLDGLLIKLPMENTGTICYIIPETCIRIVTVRCACLKGLGFRFHHFHCKSILCFSAVPRYREKVRFILFELFPFWK